MQQRRFRPGDVLDDYCPRERRITDHAVVAMIDDRIKQTRCVVCDAEHEYKEGKVPPQRRKRPQSALFAQVLDGLQAPQRVARRADFGEPDDMPGVEPAPPVSPSIPSPPLITGNGRHAEHTPVVAAPVVTTPAETPAAEAELIDPPPMPEEGPVRRPLIRATLPRPEGQPVAARALPEFTIRQPHNGRGGHRGGGGGRRRGGQEQQAQGHGGGHGGRFGRHAQGPHGHGGRRQGGHGRPGGSRRGGKKR